MDPYSGRKFSYATSPFFDIGNYSKVIYVTMSDGLLMILFRYRKLSKRFTMVIVLHL